MTNPIQDSSTHDLKKQKEGRDEKKTPSQSSQGRLVVPDVHEKQ